MILRLQFIALCLWTARVVQSFRGSFHAFRVSTKQYRGTAGPVAASIPRRQTPPAATEWRSGSATKHHMFNKMFEESGPLGKGITVGKVQVALQCRDRNPKTSIFGLLEAKTTSDNGKGGGSFSSNQLGRLGNDVCLALLRKSDDWTAACSTFKWFSQNDQGKAESHFNDVANREASKFEKEYVPEEAEETSESGGATLAVVSLVVEIQGDQTKFEGAGYSLSGTKDVLSSLAGDCLVDGGSCVNAVEVFWCPGDRNEVLTKDDLYIDFPELIDL